MKSLPEKITDLAEEFGGRWIEKKDGFQLEVILAERKAFLSRKKLVYQARIRVDEGAREITLSESLKEYGLGVGGETADSGLTPGFGFITETYRTGLNGVRRGTVAEQSLLFGKKYQVRFDFSTFRNKMIAAAEATGYRIVPTFT